MSAAASPDACVGDDQGRPPPVLPSGEAVAHHVELVRAVTDKLAGPEIVWVAHNHDHKHGVDTIELFGTRAQAVEWVIEQLEDVYQSDDPEVVEAIQTIKRRGDCTIQDREWFTVSKKPVQR